MDYSVKEDLAERIFDGTKRLILPSKSNGYKSRFLQSSILLWFVILLLAFKMVTILVSINLPYNIFFADITKSALESFANQTRREMGLPVLIENEKLEQAAMLKAKNMVQNQYFSHTSPTGIEPWHWFSLAGYKYKYAGENLAIGFYDSEEVYNAWISSPSHAANILNPNYTEIGTAVLNGFGPNNTVVVVQEFASPAPLKALKPEEGGLDTNVADTKTDTDVNIDEQTPITEDSGRVLSRATESQNYIESPRSNGVNNLLSKLLNFILYDYDGLLRGIFYGLSLIMIGILLALIIFNFNISFRRELVLRAVLIMVLLSVATSLNKEMIISLIPHQVII